jgi:hypothetical protein
MPPRHCSIIAGQIAKTLDRDVIAAKEVQQGQRVGQRVTDHNWKFPNGVDMVEYGPDLPPLAKREWLSIIGYVNNSGPNGAKFASMVERMNNLIDVNTGTEYKQFVERVVKGLKPEEQMNVVSMIEQRKLDVDANGMYRYAIGSDKNVQPISARAAEAVTALKPYLEMAEQRAERELGWYRAEPRRLSELYLTRSVRNEEFQRQTEQGLAERVAKQNGRAAPNTDDYLKAKKLYENYAGHQHALRNNMFKQQFLDRAEGREYDLEKIMQLYVKQHQHALQEKRVFGNRTVPTQTPELARQFLHAIEQENPQSSALRHATTALYNDAFGMTPSDWVMNSAIVKGLGDLQALKLTFSTIKQLSSFGNTWLKTDLPTAMRALSSLLRNSEDVFDMPTREAAGMFASVLNNTLYESTLFQGGGSPVSWLGEKMLQYNGFTPLDKGMRMLSGTAGAVYVQKQADKLVRTGSTKAARLLTEFGISPEKVRAAGGRLTLEEKLIAGQKLLNANDGRGRPSDLPVFTANNPDMWRALLTFKTLAINKVRMVWDMMYSNPIRVLAFGTAITPGIGYMMNSFEGLILEDTLGIPRQKYRDRMDGLAQYLEAASMGDSFGYLSDMASAIYIGGLDGMQPRRFAEPPILATVDDIMTMAGHITHGKTKDIEKDVLRQFGGLGSALTRVVW